MPLYATASTVPVNPPGAEPILTEEQVWKGLEQKARKPSAFVPAITKCEVLEDQGATIVRKVYHNRGPVGATERLDLDALTIVYFDRDDGQRVTNILSRGPGDELFLTYTFAHGVPGVPADRPRPPSHELNRQVGAIIAHGVEVVRQMVREGKL